MKKIISFVVVILIAISPSFAQSKQIQKAAKKGTKELVKEGFELLELGDLQSRMVDFLNKEASGMQQIVGTAIRGDRNLAKTDAFNDAATQYASAATSMVKGRITSNLSSINDQEVNDIVAAYERLLLNEIKGELRSYITVYRKQNKKYEVRQYCLVDHEAAHTARMKAMRLALEELELSQKYGSEVSDWIDEGLNK